MSSSTSAMCAMIMTAAIPALASAAPATYVPDNNHTFVRFAYNHMGFSTVA